MSHSPNPGFKSGAHWACCDRCGFDFYHYELKREWNGLWVCVPCYEVRHPQDFVRGRADKIVGDDPLRPCPPDTLVVVGTIDGVQVDEGGAEGGPELTFTLGGVQTLTADGTAQISGDTSGFTAVVDSYVVSSGDWILENAAGTLSLSSVVGTPSSMEQVDEDSPLTSNNVLTAGTYTASTASAPIRYLEFPDRRVQLAYIDFTLGQSEGPPVAGDLLSDSGSTSTDTWSGTVHSIELTSGTWAGDDAAGRIYFTENSASDMDQVSSDATYIDHDDGTTILTATSGTAQITTNDPAYSVPSGTMNNAL